MLLHVTQNLLEGFTNFFLSFAGMAEIPFQPQTDAMN